MNKFETTKCPYCGTLMEDGFIGVGGSYLPSLKWFKKKRFHGLGGEHIGYQSLTGIIYLDSIRCNKCRTIISKY